MLDLLCLVAWSFFGVLLVLVLAKQLSGKTHIRRPLTIGGYCVHKDQVEDVVDSFCLLSFIAQLQ